MPSNLENSAVATRLERVSFHSNPKQRQCQKCSNYHTIAFFSHTSKVILKILQDRLQKFMNLSFQMFTLDLEIVEDLEKDLEKAADL